MGDPNAYTFGLIVVDHASFCNDTYVTRVSLNWEVEHELSLIQRPVQNQNLFSRGSPCAQRLRHSALFAKAYQEKSLDIGLGTFRSLASIFAVGECVSKILQTPPS